MIDGLNHLNQLGFGVGGPLIKDRLFWFYAFDEFRRNFPGTAKANNPGAFFINANAALNGTETCTITPTSATFAGNFLVVKLGIFHTVKHDYFRHMRLGFMLDPGFDTW